jgi:DNA excision repair protein ERCC-4
VTVDVHEGERIVRILQGLGCDVTRARLAFGDFLAGAYVVERKTVRDLHLSVVEGRFWRQVGGLRRASRRYLLVEGVNLHAGPLAPNAVRGICLTVMELGVPIIRSTGLDDSARWLSLLARRTAAPRLASRPTYDQRPTAPGSAAEAALAAVPGISVVLARRLLDRFGSVAGVISAGPSEWATVDGVGAARMAALQSTLTE